MKTKAQIFKELWTKPFTEYLTEQEIQYARNATLVNLRLLVLNKAGEMFNKQKELTNVTSNNKMPSL